MKKGFTLIEIMIAIGIFMTVSYLAFLTMDGMFVLKEDVQYEQEYTQNIIRVIQRLKREFANAFLLQYNKEDGRIKTTFKVEKEFDIDKITFTSFSHLRTHFNVKESDQTEITYFGKKMEDGDGYFLFKRESSFIDDKPEEDGKEYEIAKNVKSFHCKFYKAETEEWVEEWNTEGIETGRKLPPYILCDIVFLNYFTDNDFNDANEDAFQFSVKLHLKEALQ